MCDDDDEGGAPCALVRVLLLTMCLLCFCREVERKAATPLEQKRSFELGVVLALKYLPVMQI